MDWKLLPWVLLFVVTANAWNKTMLQSICWHLVVDQFSSHCCMLLLVLWSEQIYHGLHQTQIHCRSCNTSAQMSTEKELEIIYNSEKIKNFLTWVGSNLNRSEKKGTTHACHHEYTRPLEKWLIVLHHLFAHLMHHKKTVSQLSHLINFSNLLFEYLHHKCCVILFAWTHVLHTIKDGHPSWKGISTHQKHIQRQKLLYSWTIVEPCKTKHIGILWDSCHNFSQVAWKFKLWSSPDIS